MLFSGTVLFALRNTHDAVPGKRDGFEGKDYVNFMLL